jgi:hypothetical protein
MALYFIFWDGVGYGKKDPAVNPFFSAHLPTFMSLFGGDLPSLSFTRFSSATVSMSPVNTTLRVAGLPQSGTGQTAIMTGVNAAQLIGKHFGPHPYSTLVPIIKEHNLFVRLRTIGRNSFFVNGYPQRYFDYIFGPKGKIPTVALSYLTIEKKLNDHTAVKERTAISADISGTRWKELGHADIDPMDPRDAGRHFYAIGRMFDLTFFEYFVTDMAGHARDMKIAAEMLERMDGFLAGLLDRLDRENDTVLMISDHGNIEDLSVRTHTRNPVPLIVIGKHHSYFCSRVRNLTHITPAIITYFANSME